MSSKGAGVEVCLGHLLGGFLSPHPASACSGRKSVCVSGWRKAPVTLLRSLAGPAVKARRVWGCWRENSDGKRGLSHSGRGLPKPPSTAALLSHLLFAALAVHNQCGGGCLLLGQWPRSSPEVEEEEGGHVCVHVCV